MFKDGEHWADKAFWIVAPVVVVASAAGGFYYYYKTRQKPVEPTPTAVVAPPVAAEDEPGIKHPIPRSSTVEGVEEQPLPPMAQSDEPLSKGLEGVFGDETVQKWFLTDGLVRRIVVTVDNIPRQKIAVEKRPLKALEGQTIVVTEGDLITLSDANFARYQPLVVLVKATNIQSLSDLYIRFYPLFQQAYEDLGYPGQYFNDRLVEAIDTLLATPDLNGRVAVIQPRVFYEFADPKLEARPAGQKLLLRMGVENAALMKQKLTELRAAVTSGQNLPTNDAGRTSAPPSSGISSPPGGLRHWL